MWLLYIVHVLVGWCCFDAFCYVVGVQRVSSLWAVVDCMRTVYVLVGWCCFAALFYVVGVQRSDSNFLPIVQVVMNHSMYHYNW